MNFLQKTASTISSHQKSRRAPIVEQIHLKSDCLGRTVILDVYLPVGYHPGSGKSNRLILFNDGQDLPRMGFDVLFQEAIVAANMLPAIVVGVYASDKRTREYGTARQADYKGRGDLAPRYTRFILEELLPNLQAHFDVSLRATETAFAGFSLGGLSALDIAWANPTVFGAVGVFSGSLWWRSSAVRPEDPDADRIMHDIIQSAKHVDDAQRFWFQTGTLDEEDDRNNNGVIDAIDDTLDLIKVLKERGINEKRICYVEIEGGRHEPKTWGEAMPGFLQWLFG